MRKATLLVVAALAVAVLVLAWWSARRRHRAEGGAEGGESPHEAYRRSAGDFDEAARRALAGATRGPNPTPADHALAATIITRNVLGQEHRPALDANGAPTRRAVEHTARRRRLFGEARDHLMAALRGVAALPRAAPAPAAAPRRAPRAAPAAAARPRPPVRPEDNPEHVIDMAELFAFGGAHDLLQNDPLLAILAAEDGLPGADGDFGAFLRAAGPWPRGWHELAAEAVLAEALAFGGGGRAGVDGPLAALAAQQRANRTQERRELAGAAAAAQGGGRRAAVAAYVDLATQNTNDPQNAHDPGVLACLRAVVERLRADQAGLAPPGVEQVCAEIQAAGPALSEGRPQLVADALAAARRMDAGERVVAIGASDGECLGRVWLRASDPRNAAARGAIRQAVFDALVDAWEGAGAARHVVCVNGRTSRLLSALVLLDWDRRNWEVKKLEQFKNDIFEKARGVADAEARRAAAGPDAAARQAARAYLAKTTEELRAAGDVPEAAADALAARMRAAIGEMVDAHVRFLEDDLGIKGAIPAPMVEGVKTEAQAAV